MSTKTATICAGYQPHPAQLRVHQSRARFLSVASGVRGGKSKCGAAEFTARIARDLAAGKGNVVAGIGRARRPRLHYWVVAPISSLLKEPTRYLFEAIPPEWIERYYGDDGTLWLKGDILIEFKTAENPLHLVSVGLHGVWVDEAARVKPEAWRGQLRQRLSDHDGWAIFTTTPLGRNWFYEEAVARDGSDGFATVAWKTSDNPYIPAAEIENARKTLPARYFQREYEASFDAFLGNVYDEFRESTHVLSESALRLEYGVGDKPLRSIFKRVIGAVDWGWNAPGCILIVGDHGDGRYTVLDEDYAANRIIFGARDSDTWVGAAWKFRDRWGGIMFECDPARPDAIYDFQRASLAARGANNDIVEGIRRVSEALHVPPDGGKPRLRILDRCVNLRRELPNYLWAQNRQGDTMTDVPADGQSDHALDPLRYAMAELTQHAPARIIPADPFRAVGRPIG